MAPGTSIRLVRHATLVVRAGGHRLLVDPMLSTEGANPPIENTPNDRRNPLVPLPRIDLSAVDAVLVTHLHSDHFDEAAAEALSDSIPLYCQPQDEAALADMGFTDVRPVADSVEAGDLTITRTPGRHGYGDLAEQMGPVSGFVLDPDDGATVYIAGDTVWYPPVEEVIETHEPDAVVLNAGGARFTEGRPITMTDEDVTAVCEAAPGASILAVHLEAINHCLQTREELAAAVDEAVCGDRLVIPEDGEWTEID